jgi:hypothetical protein
VFLPLRTLRTLLTQSSVSLGRLARQLPSKGRFQMQVPPSRAAKLTALTSLVVREGSGGDGDGCGRRFALAT